MMRPLRLSRLVHYVALIALAALFAFPFYWMFVTSVEPTGHLSDIPPNVLPLWDWSNYADAWNAAPWGRYFLNTVFIASAATLLALATSLFAGYAFGSLSFRGKRLLFLAVLMVLIVPDEVILIPQYIILDDLNWLNTYQAQIIPFGASAFGIFLLRQFFLSLPQEFWDAAQIDGCSRTRFLLQVAAPLARPVLAAVGLYTFLGMWNQFLYPLVIAGLDPNVQPIQVGLATFLRVNSVDWSQLAAASVFTTLPILVVFLIVQKQIIEGVASASGSIVG
ncbi:MAG: carbohydrate ABC transporter permease [Chloroflexi bacterium]|nr:carbohydrate ABC transporter permease [Chloroflexota bacterium]